ncbi:MAG: TlpA family protein disulfide reductase, partial [Acidimicrobiia bacterium]|nr:TlpA family protein disulfide reductase [Acidimicrobiia bacterium]
VLNFWASWCPPCLAEMPDFEEVHQQLKGEVAFLGLNLQDDLAAAQRLADQTGVTYPLAADPEGAIFRRFGGIAMPTTVLIDADGEVVEVHAGVIFADDLAELIGGTLLDS